MAAEEVQEGEGEGEGVGVGVGVGALADSKDLMQQNKALDSLTDHVEDRQLDSIRVHQDTGYLEEKKKRTQALGLLLFGSLWPFPLFSLTLVPPFVILHVNKAMASIAAAAEADRNAMRVRDKELAAVKINAADVDIIANELELDKKVAETKLREHKGDAIAAIRSLLH